MVSYEGGSSLVFMTLEYRDELRNWEEVLPAVLTCYLAPGLQPQPLLQEPREWSGSDSLESH